jgi:transcription elongation factor GreB
MNPDPDDDEDEDTPPSQRIYLTPQGAAMMQEELRQLMKVERPRIVEIVSWAAGNGDRSENGDYLYGKKRLREIDRRARILGRRLKHAEIVDPSLQTRRDQVFFGATVTFENEAGVERIVTLVGVDEADMTQNKVSLHAPIGRALLRAKLGDQVRLVTPAGVELIEIVAVNYPDKA